MLSKCFIQYVSKFGKVNSGHRTGKGQFSFQSQRRAVPKKGNPKECSNYNTTVLISCISKVMLEILQARLQQYMKQEFADVQAGFRKGKGTRNQIANIHWVIKRAREFQKNLYFCFIDYAKPLTVWTTANYGKFLEMGIPDHLTCLLRNLYASQEATA